MLPKNNIKYITKEQKNKEYNNKKDITLKNLYAKIKKNIKTSFSRPKQKNSINLINSKKLTEKPNKKNNNINLLINKKKEESRNYNTNNIEKIGNQDEELIENEKIIYFNKTQKNINLLYQDFSKKMINKINGNKNNNIKNNEKDIKYSNKKNHSKDDIRESNKLKSDKELNKIDIINNKEINDMKIKLKERDRQSSLDKKSKILINKKLISKDEIFKTKNFYDKVQSARLCNYNIQKLNINININQNIDSDIKINSNKKTFRINSQKSVMIKEKEFDSTNPNKKIQKTNIIRQLTKQNSKNNSMNINSGNKTFFINDNIRGNQNKTKKKYSIVNIYNFPNPKNNNKKNIPFDREMIFDSADKNNKDISENIYFNEYYNMNDTCINFQTKDRTLNNNINGAMNNINEKNTPNSKYHNNSFSNPYSQEKISTFFYPKPVAKLKKKIFNSLSDKDLENSINNLEIDNDDYNYRDKDSLEINNNKNSIDYKFKELLIYIKILNKIINTQKKIIKEYIQNQNNLKKELKEKNQKIKNYKDICLKLMINLKIEKEINISNELNKKRIKIQYQLLKENKILRKLYCSSITQLQKNGKENNELNNFSLTHKNFYKEYNNEDSSINIYHIKKVNNNIYNNYGLIEKQKNGLNSFYNTEIFVNKKREKSYENKKIRK